VLTWWIWVDWLLKDRQEPLVMQIVSNGSRQLFSVLFLGTLDQYFYQMKLQIRPELFWDVDFTKLDEQNNRRLVIERVFSYGTIPELQRIISFYGLEIIGNELKKVGYLDPKTFEFAITFLGLKKEEMKCYIKKQSQPQHWI
jgi:hypothetical protein